MERNKRAAGLADKPNLFLDPCSSAGLAAISLDRLHPDHTSHRAHNCLVHATQLTLLNSRLLNSHCSTHDCSTHTAQLKKFDAGTIFRIQLRKRHLET